MEWRELAPADLYGLRNPLIIDVRSPSEFAKERLPEAINIPLLSNEERAIVGTIYNEQGDLVARRQALAIIAPKIPVLLEEIIAHKERSRPIVVHCWRGGLRSEAVCSVLSIAGIASHRLTGGYKAWRNMVLGELVQDCYKFAPLVLYGLTGTGKTELLQALSRLGCQVLDLEDLANHRGSAFGGLGKAEQPSQKNFEAALWTRLRKLDPVKSVFIEAESRKIGKLSLLDPILKRIKEGPAVLIESSLAARAKRISNDYLNSCSSPQSALEESLILLDKIKENLEKKHSEEINKLAVQGNIEGAVLLLLQEYYDPLYGKSIKHKQFELRICSDDLPTAALKLRAWAESMTESRDAAKAEHLTDLAESLADALTENLTEPLATN